VHLVPHRLHRHGRRGQPPDRRLRARDADREAGEERILLHPVGGEVESGTEPAEVDGVAGQVAVDAVEGEGCVEEHGTGDVAGAGAGRAEASGHQRHAQGEHGYLVGGEPQPREPPRDVAGVAPDGEGREHGVVGLHRGRQPDPFLVDRRHPCLQGGTFVGRVGKTRHEGRRVHAYDGDRGRQCAGEIGDIDLGS
jgi:hypothetical protein